MTILQAGLPKSGNFWLYRILRLSMERAGLERRSFIQHHPIHEEAQHWDLSFEGQADVDALVIEPEECAFRISAVFREPIADIEAYLQQCSHVWTHSPICTRSFEVLPRFDHIVYIIRDPRDVAISYSKFAFTKHKLTNHPPHYEQNPASYLKHHLDGLLRRWVRHVGGYLKHRDALNVHVVFYERMLHDFENEFASLLDALGLDLSSEDRAAIQQEVDFSTMKKRNPAHVRKGRARQWADVLTDAQHRKAERLASRLMRMLGYPSARDAPFSLPRLPSALSRHDLDAALAQAERTPWQEVERVYNFLTSDRPLRAKTARIRRWTLSKLPLAG